LVGLVGKPSVGKSTFFSAMTLIPVAISGRPFTTIKPNRGIGYVRSPCVCKEFDVKDQPSNSICLEETRLIPVEIIDCAGLVPGAWQGRGLGNQFLDEVRKADALIHIVDASGSTDSEGRQLASGTRDPAEDVQFLNYEVAMWLTQVIKKDWAKIASESETKKKSLATMLSDRLSGLGIGEVHVAEALKRTELNAEKPTRWSDEDLLRFSSELRSVSKPMLIAANKMDMPFAEENAKKLRGLGYPVVPCCAEAELALRRAAEKGLIDYKPGDCSFKLLKPDQITESQKKALETIRERILLRFGSSGVQEAVNMAFFKLLGMIVVYPVEDAERFADHRGRVLPDAYLVPYGTTAREFAYRIHTELGEGFIYAVDVRTKRRLGEDYVLKDRDVVKIFSAKARA